MFNSGTRANQRCNGLKAPSSDQIISGKSLFLSKSKIANDNYYNDESPRERTYFYDPMSLSNSFIHNSNNFDHKVKLEPEELDFNRQITAHSIIDVDVNIKNETSTNQILNNAKAKDTHHEARPRINSASDVFNHYQHHWFSASLEKFKLEDRSREERIEITRHEFRRHIQQLMKSNVGQPNKFQEFYDQYVRHSVPIDKSRHHGNSSSANRLVAPRLCEVEKCVRPALPCTKHCTLHIMMNKEQVLFEYCTAKFADNTQCCTPVFDISHELPLCAEHARKRDNYKLYQEAKPKKIRKKVKPSAMIRPQKRNKKRKKIITKPLEDSDSCAILNSVTRNSPVTEEICEITEAESPDLEVEDMHMVDQVLGLNENGLEHALVAQAHLLEETDISTVLSTIQVDELSDFFTANRNGEYEVPSREEAEELEKALAAVDNDVKSLEKLSQSQELLDSLLDEHALTETLVQIPEMFHNGYTSCGDSMVTQTSSYLLPVVEPHSHS